VPKLAAEPHVREAHDALSAQLSLKDFRTWLRTPVASPS
jgi:hypothetical protein